MTNEEVIKKLESVVLPDIRQDGYRQELRSVLLKQYVDHQHHPALALPRRFGFPRMLWKGIIMASAASLLALVALAASILIPGQPSNANIVQSVLASKEVKAALGNDEIFSATITASGNGQAQVIIQGRGGDVIIVQVDIGNRAPVIKQITYLAFIGGSHVVLPEGISEEEQVRVMTIAQADPTFRSLIGNGAIVNRTDALPVIAVIRDIATGVTTHNRETWAMIDLRLPTRMHSFLVNLDRNLVIDHGERSLPSQEVYK